MSSRLLAGESLAPGIANGMLQMPRERSHLSPLGTAEVQSAAGEIDRFNRQVRILAADIQQAVGDLESESLTAEAEIMRAHLMMLEDRDFHRQVHALIRDARCAAEAAVKQVLEQMAGVLRTSQDSFLAERSADLLDLAMRLKTKLCPGHASDLDTLLSHPKGAVAAVPDLLPSLVLEARVLGVAAFVVERGTTVSHGAILAKSFGMPTIRVVSLEALHPFSATKVLVDGNAGEVLIEPTEAELVKRRPHAVDIPSAVVAGAPDARVWLSVVDPTQLESVSWTDVAGVGLYRTEALFMKYRENFPTEQEQLAVYRRIFCLAGSKPVVVRTVDMGADKPVAHMDPGPQENPCLGLRAHRFFHFHPEILVTQVRATLRAAQGEHALRLMFPMLETIDQWYFVQDLVRQAIASLEREHLPFQRNFLQGVLIETPSAALSMSRFLEVADFASIGTNDLVQYLFAVERNAVNVANLYQPEHPVVLKVLHRLAQQASDQDTDLSICGEVAADPVIIPLLVGLGIRNFSVAPHAVGTTMARLRSITERECRLLADQCLQAETGAEVRSLLGRREPTHCGGQKAEAGQAIDPVCEMVVQINGNPLVLRLKGETHYFCSRQCLEKYSELHQAQI